MRRCYHLYKDSQHFSYFHPYRCDEGYNAASRLIDVAKRRGTIGAEVGEKSRITGTNLAFGFDCSVFEWMAKPQEAWRGERLGRAMKQLHGMANSNVPKGMLFPSSFFSISVLLVD
jgi:hypothetical protein